jgi:hypothetical protein
VTQITLHRSNFPFSAKFLNQGCAWAPVLESMLFSDLRKIPFSTASARLDRDHCHATLHPLGGYAAVIFDQLQHFGVVGDDAFVIFEHKNERLAPEQRRKHGAPSSVREPGIIARFIACSSATFTRTAS